MTSQIERKSRSPLFLRSKGVSLYRSKVIFSILKENREVLSGWEGVMLDITCAFSSSGDEERMVEDWISICGFLEDIESKQGKVPTLFEGGIGIQEKSG